MIFKSNIPLVTVLLLAVAAASLPTQVTVGGLVRARNDHGSNAVLKPTVATGNDRMNSPHLQSRQIERFGHSPKDVDPANEAARVYKRGKQKEKKTTTPPKANPNPTPGRRYTPEGLSHLQDAKDHHAIAQTHYANAVNHLLSGDRKTATELELLGDSHERMAMLHTAAANQLHSYRRAQENVDV